MSVGIGCSSWLISEMAPTRAIVGGEHLDKLLLIEHTVERGVVDWLMVDSSEDSLACVHNSILPYPLLG